MSDDCGNAKTCIFHKEHKDKMNALWDWHLTNGEVIRQLVKKVDKTNAFLGVIAVAIVGDVVARIFGSAV